MAVEIVILSGARQGQRVLLEEREFRAGDEAACEVFFDPQKDPAVSGRCALFRLSDDGWIVRRVGRREIFLNQELVVGNARIRSGDLVRMSERGPDFSFEIVTQAAAASRAGAAAPPSLPASAVETPSSGAGPELPGRVAEQSLGETPTACAPAAPAAGGIESGPFRQTATEPWRHAFWALVGLAACMLVVVAVLAVVFVGLAARRGTELADGANSPAGQTPPEDLTKTPAPQPEKPPTEPEKRAEPIAEPTDVWEKLPEKLQGAVFLIQVEVESPSGGHFLPFATCCAIGENTLLVSAREATILARWRQQDGYRLWATNQANQIKQEIRDIRVDRTFAELAGKPNDWIFANLAVLTVEGKLPKVARLMSAEELGGLEEGAPLASFGFCFEEVDKITRFDKFEPQLARGRVYLATPREKPSLVHLQAKIAGNAYGSPIVNARGEIVGVYSEVVPPESTPVKDLHLVTVIAPAAINSWLEQGDTNEWVPPPVPESSPSPQPLP